MRTVEFYKFVMDTEEWNYTSGDASIAYGGDTYTPVPISRNSPQIKNEVNKANIDVKLSIFDELSQRLLTQFNEKVLSLTVYEQDQETSETVVVWKGRLSTTSPDSTFLKMTFESIFTSLRRPGLRARYQKFCRHVLYNSGCGLSPVSFETESVLTDLESNVLTVPEAATLADGYFTGGMVQTAGGIYGYITAHVGESITIQRPIDSLITDFDNSGYGKNYGNYYGDITVKLYPGCDRSRATCEQKFNNLLNFGGFPWIPSKNPMQGSIV